MIRFPRYIINISLTSFSWFVLKGAVTYNLSKIFDMICSFTIFLGLTDSVECPISRYVYLINLLYFVPKISRRFPKEMKKIVK